MERMPRIVDHEARRRELAEAATRAGLVDERFFLVAAGALMCALVPG
jgi:hypothetical protein